MFSVEAPRRSALHFELRLDVGRSSLQSGTRLLRQQDSQLMQQQRQVSFRFCVARHYQPATIRCREANIERLNRRQFLQHRTRRQPRRMRLQSLLQRHRQAIRQKRNQDVRIDAVLQLMIDRTNSQIVFVYRGDGATVVS